jgi:hypothetical protein
MVLATWRKASGSSGKTQLIRSRRGATKNVTDDRFLVLERIPIDLAVLCNILERLYGLAIMTARSKGKLHGVLLPRTWVLALWKDFITFKERALAPLWDLAQATEILLKGIYTGEYLRHTMIDPDNFSEFGS